MNIGEIRLPVKCSKRWFFWPVFYAAHIAYRLRLISITRAARMASKGMRVEIGK